MKKTLVLLSASVFLIYGIGFIAFPLQMLQFAVDGGVNSKPAVIDIRATYGGLSLAVGVMLSVLVLNEKTVRLSLQLLLILMLCMILGRSTGILVDGQPNRMMWIYLASEVFIAAACLFFLRANKTSSDSDS